MPSEIGFLVGIDEAHACHAFRNRSNRLDDCAFVATQIETRFDGFARQKMHFLDRERDIVGLGRLAQPGARAKQPAYAFSEHNDVSGDLPILAVGPHAYDFTPRILQQLGHRRFAQDDGAGLLNPFREPFVELRANDRVAVRALLVKFVGSIVQPSVGVVVHHPEALLDQMALQWRVFAEIWNELLEHFRI